MNTQQIEEYHYSTLQYHYNLRVWVPLLPPEQLWPLWSWHKRFWAGCAMWSLAPGRRMLSVSEWGLLGLDLFVHCIPWVLDRVGSEEFEGRIGSLGLFACWPPCAAAYAMFIAFLSRPALTCWQFVLHWFFCPSGQAGLWFPTRSKSTLRKARWCKFSSFISTP